MDSSTQKHVERMARGRSQRQQQRFQQQPEDDFSPWGPCLALGDGVYDKPRDLFEVCLENHQKQAARRMLSDFESAGVDEDLEALKAGWSTSFKHRPGLAQPRRPVPADLNRFQAAPPSNSKRNAISQKWALQDASVEEDDVEICSVLAAEGERAKQRLDNLSRLRRLAGTGTGTGSGSPIQFQQGLPSTASYSSYGGLASAPAMPSLQGLPSQHAGHRKQQPSSAPSFGADPWSDWEQRWTQEFHHFEEIERTRQLRHRIREQEAEDEREAEWYRKVEAAKRQDEASKAAPNRGQSQKRPTAQSRPTADSRRPPADSNSWQRPPFGAEESPKGPERPPLPKPLPQPLPKAAAGPAFASFADFATAWSKFESRLSSVGSQSPNLRCSDIPWPTSLPSISGVIPGDGSAEHKKKLRAALMRWHPDKWAPILDRVVEGERPQVMERVKEVTIRILDEKNRLGNMA
ncbi:unnamed protein product [Polarella glacialis]|uniref:Uncharacterized protein n=1 Tax=Polarella glacialis TaxID=89957 RepID=A0A813I6U0_POLGL|nr:unnamed protein product [Polarella glacialis]CAE8645557.1 unnamed protein product [Polarella glacialis]|mmetsp:Transcript_54508/g.98288  ORF Transcript_54508/g.98288 Transcript_54508/m.98288 type:complete len:463 (+) Transcript_54508:105-1493(+)